MERGDLAAWVDSRLVVVLEGVLAQIPPPRVERSGLFGRNKVYEWTPVDQWGWSRSALKVINDKASRLNIPVDVVTFLSPDVADQAADWLSKYEVRVSSCEYSNFDLFCESLSWRPSVVHVIDTDLERLQHYGARAYEMQWGSIF